MSNHFVVWNVDPVITFIGPLQLRYYGIFFALSIFIGFVLMRRILRIYGYKDRLADDFLLWGVLGMVVGARLIHCFFYEPTYYLNNPVEILKVYKGGIASHGATIGLIVTVIVFIKRKRIKFYELADGIVFAAAVGATLVRLGNLFNSEIVGRITHLSWGWKFLRHSPDMILARNAATGLCDVTKMECLIQYWPVRHPSQLYESVGGATILLIMLIVSMVFKNLKRPGLYAGLFLILYFSFRFCIEFVKEYQALEKGLTMGQYLSLPFIIFGIYSLCYAFKTKAKQEVTNEKASSK